MDHRLGEWRSITAGTSHVVYRDSDHGRPKLTAKVVKRGVAWRWTVGLGKSRNVRSGYATSETLAQAAANEAKRGL